MVCVFADAELNDVFCTLLSWRQQLKFVKHVYLSSMGALNDLVRVCYINERMVTSLVLLVGTTTGMQYTEWFVKPKSAVSHVNIKQLVLLL